MKNNGVERESDVLKANGALCFGCIVKDGVIRPALSPVKISEFLLNVRFAAYADKCGKAALIIGNSLYLANPDGTAECALENFTASNPFAFYTGGGDLCIGGNVDCAVITGDGVEVKPYDFYMYGGAVKNGRLFAQDKEDTYKIRWSGSEGGLDLKEGLDGAGWLKLNSERGKIIRLASYKGNVVAVCEYGLALLSVSGAPETFKVSYIDGAIEKIYGNTARVAGDKFVFLTERGLRIFDGIKTENLEIPLLADVSAPRFCESCGDEYFIFAESKNLQKKAIFVVNLTDCAAYMVDLPATAAFSNGQLHCFADGGFYRLDTGGEYTFLSGELNFGARGRKVIKKIFAGNSASVDFEVISGGKSRILRGVQGYCLPCAGGNTFKIKIKSRGEIHGVTAVAEVLNEF